MISEYLKEESSAKRQAAWDKWGLYVFTPLIGIALAATIFFHM